MHRLGLLSLTLAIAACATTSEDRCRGAPCDGRAAVSLEGRPLAAAERGGGPPEAATVYQHEDVPVQTVNQWMASGKTMILLDVREPSEYQAGHLAGAQSLAWSSGVLQQKASTIKRDRPIVVYCASGSRSTSAATFLAGQGLRPVYDMLGGIGAWQGAGLPVVK